MILAFSVEGNPRNISMKCFEIGLLALEEMLFKGFFLFLALVGILLSGVEPF